MKQFSIPTRYRSPLIAAIKQQRKDADKLKKDFTPTILDFGPLKIYLARHFGFCYGVENAIEIAFETIEQNPGKRIFLLSEMIHNPHVNSDLVTRGVAFLQTAEGEQLIPFSELRSDDVVIVPAFGTTREIFEKLEGLGINPQNYNATCPFVEKVWKRGRQLAQQGYTIVIHGKHTHEETRATFSQIRVDGPSVVVRDRREADLLCQYVRGELPKEQFFKDFVGRLSPGFRVPEDLERLGVVNQTTMLAEETHEIALMIKQAVAERFKGDDVSSRFADTRDTLCYATSENQGAMRGLLRERADLAIVVGGYNSSNTSHLVELCEGIVPVFYVKDAEEIVSRHEIRHLDLHQGVITSRGWLPEKERVKVLISAGASCPDAMVEAVLSRVASLFPEAKALRDTGSCSVVGS
jgi:4-hydroxy-3-methylbut-2-enyl diphosphate reductase